MHTFTSDGLPCPSSDGLEPKANSHLANCEILVNARIATLCWSHFGPRLYAGCLHDERNREVGCLNADSYAYFAMGKPRPSFDHKL